MSSCLLSACLSLTSLVLLLPVSEAQYYDLTPAPDYDDYNATFEYSFYSNGSSEDLDKLSERFNGEEDTAGEQEEEDATVTMTTTRGTTEQDGGDVRNAASLPVSLESGTLVCTLMIVINLNLQQLHHTL